MLLAVCLAIGYFGIGFLVATSRPVSQLIAIETLKAAAFNEDHGKVVRFELVLRIAAVVVWPFYLAVVWSKPVVTQSSGESELLAKTNDGTPHSLQGIPLNRLGGVNSLKCLSCGWKNDKTLSFVHGFGSDQWQKTGYQCQQCGAFHEIEHSIQRPVQRAAHLPACRCGGSLSREAPIFCPQCRSTRIDPSPLYIT